MTQLAGALPNPYKRFAWIGKPTPEEVTWTCETCGVIEPKYWPVNGHYIKQKCECQVEAEQKLIDEQHRHEEMLFLARMSFDWLGSHWSDAPMRAKTFENFKPDLQQDAYEIARAFSMQLDGTLVLHGSYGTGKTHLLAAICNEVRLRKVKSHFTTAPKLFKAVQEKIQYDEDYHKIIRQASQVDLLVIDDIDKAKISEFREEIYFDIIDTRTTRGLPIAISTNRLSELANYVGGAACSRLAIGQIAVDMVGEDYRPNL